MSKKDISEVLDVIPTEIEDAKIIDEKPTEDQWVEQQMSEEEKKREPVRWDYGDLIFECSCGHTSILSKNVPGDQGQVVTLTPTEGSMIVMVCEKCEHKMSVKFIESTDKPIKDEQVQETSETEQVTVGVSDGDKQPDETDLQGTGSI